MLYLTIIIVTAIIAVCFVIYKYIDCTYNPDIYTPEDVTQAATIIRRQLDRCDKYKSAEGDDKYIYNYSQKELNEIFIDLALALNIDIEDYE